MTNVTASLTSASFSSALFSNLSLSAKIRQVIGLVQENADKNIAPEDLQTFYRVLEQLLNNFEEMSEHYDTVFESLRREI